MVYDLETLEMSPPELPAPSVPELCSPTKRTGTRFSRQCVGGLCLLGGLLLVRLLHPQGATAIAELLTAEHIGPVEQAGQAMVLDVISGTPLPDALAAFCREVLNALP